MAGPRRDISDELDAWVLRLRRQHPEMRPAPAPKKPPRPVGGQGQPLGKSGVRGVSLHRRGRWHAKVCHKGKVIYVGLYATKDEAVAARAERVRELRGEVKP